MKKKKKKRDFRKNKELQILKIYWQSNARRRDDDGSGVMCNTRRRDNCIENGGRRRNWTGESPVHPFKFKSFSPAYA